MSLSVQANADQAFRFGALLGGAHVKVKTLLNGGDQPAAQTSDWITAPFLGGAVHGSGRNQFGAVFHYTKADGIGLWSIRPLDYKYRAFDNLNLKMFLGASRYDRETAAHGYYLGAGFEWIGWREDLGLNIEFAYGDKVARDRVLPDDPPREKADDIFYDIYSVNAYVAIYF